MAGMQTGGLWPTSRTVSGALPTEAFLERPDTVHWGAAIAYGLGAAFLGGIIWGIIAYGVGYVFVWGGIVIGVFVAWATHKGAGRATGGLMVYAGLLTLLAVFIGDITAWSLAAAPYGATPVDVLRVYPELLAYDPGGAALTYIFGFIGVVVAMVWLYGKIKAERRPRWIPPPTPFPAYGAPPPVPLTYGGPTPMPDLGSPSPAPTQQAAAAPAVENLSGRGTAGVRVRTATSPGHVLEATYQTVTGAAIVFLDGQPFTKERVWGAQKLVSVPVEGTPPQTVSFRFYGVTPKIDVSVDGALVASV